MHVLYLIGQITANPLTYGWRRQVEDYFNGNQCIKIINPCNRSFNQDALKNNDQDKNKFSKESFKEKGIVLLPHRDRRHVKQSNVVFVNMNIFSPEKIAIGTFFELAWYFDAPEKMVVGIFNGDPTKDFQCHHPFIRETVLMYG